ncbi:hypothetical protein ACROYT_G028327 [Oculina patagonica]
MEFTVLILISGCLLRISEAQVFFVLTPVNPLRAQEGANVTFHWDYTANNQLTLAQWGTMTVDNTLEIIIAQQHGTNDVEYLSPSYRGRAFIEKRTFLTLTNVRVSDSRRYGCRLTFEGGQSIVNSTKLIVSASVTTAESPTAGGATDDEKTNLHPVYLAFVAVVLILIVLVIVYFFMSRNKRVVLIDKRNSRTFGPDLEEMEMNQVPPDYTDTRMERAPNEPFDLARQEYSVIPPILPNPTERDWEVPRESLVFVKVIGKGAFGQVAKGMAHGIDNNTENRLVAIKMLRENATDENRQDLLAELNMMKNLEPHQNVIQLLGCVTKTDPVMVITEYVPYGDLLGYLRKSRGLNDTYYKDPDIKPQSSLSPKQLFSFAWDIANGMEFLSSKKIVHRDLAARNVLVGDGEICKVTDFGLARDVFKEDLYRRTATGRLPVKWTAFESLLYGICTTMSDLWSYGIVMYEIFTIGGSPYPKTDGKALASLLQEGYRMPRPPHLDEKLYEVMRSCWNEKPEDRPSFLQLRKTMKEMGDEREVYINLKDYDGKLYQNVDDMDA